METGRRIGYVRVSTNEQDTALQMAAMKRAWCDLIFEEKKSSVAIERYALNACLKELKAGDTLVVWKIDRLGRKVLELLTMLQELDNRGVFFQSLTQSIDTSSAYGKLMLEILASFAEFERNTLIERTTAGMEAARAKGHFGGRRRKIYGDRLTAMKEAYFNRPMSPATGKPMTLDELAKLFDVSKMTLCRWALHGGAPTYAPQREAFHKRNPDQDAWEARTADPSFGRNLDKKRA